jgi:uncharacterized protein YuzE
MKAFYDSEADGLEILFTDPPRSGYAEDLKGVPDLCWVQIDDSGEKVAVELLDTEKYLYLLEVAAEQYDLDNVALQAAAAAAKAAPMRFVKVEVEPEEAEELDELLAA